MPQSVNMRVYLLIYISIQNSLYIALSGYLLLWNSSVKVFYVKVISVCWLRAFSEIKLLEGNYWFHCVFYNSHTSLYKNIMKKKHFLYLYCYSFKRCINMLPKYFQKCNCFIVTYFFLQKVNLHFWTDKII